MSAALVLRRWNGTVHAHIDHIGAKSSEPQLAEELDRIKLHPDDAIRPIDTLVMFHQQQFFRAMRRAA